VFFDPFGYEASESRFYRGGAAQPLRRNQTRQVKRLNSISETLSKPR